MRDAWPARRRERGREQRDFFSWQSHNYGEQTQQFARVQMRLLDPLLRPGGTMVDVGCANGHLLKAAAHRGVRVIGVDLSRPMLLEAQRRVPAGSFLQARALNLPIRSAFSDIVTSFATLLFEQDAMGALQELRRISRPGGYVLLDLASSLNPYARSQHQYYLTRGHPGISTFSREDIETFLRDAGLELQTLVPLGICDSGRHLHGYSLLSWLNRATHRPLVALGGRDLDEWVNSRGPLQRFATRWVVVTRRPR